MIASNIAGEYKSDATGVTDSESNAATGAVAGGLVGGAAGVALSMVALAIPGIGPIVAAGPLLAGLTGAGAGAVAGGVIGALTDEGIPKEHATHYAGPCAGARARHRLRRRRAGGSRGEILRAQGGIDTRAGIRWRDNGWTGWDGSRAPTGRGSGDRAPPLRDTPIRFGPPADVGP